MNPACSRLHALMAHWNALIFAISRLPDVSRSHVHSPMTALASTEQPTATELLLRIQHKLLRRQLNVERRHGLSRQQQNQRRTQRVNAAPALLFSAPRRHSSVSSVGRCCFWHSKIGSQCSLSLVGCSRHSGNLSRSRSPGAQRSRSRSPIRQRRYDPSPAHAVKANGLGASKSGSSGGELAVREGADSRSRSRTRSASPRGQQSSSSSAYQVR